MKQSAKIWLWVALILCTATTILNASYGRWSAVIISTFSIAGLCVLLFGQRKWGFYLTCGCYLLSFATGVASGLNGESSMLAAMVMSFVGSALVPTVTALFLRSSWRFLK